MPQRLTVRTTVALVLLASALPPGTRGAEPEAGPRVRITTTTGSRKVGTLVALDERTLRVMVDPEKRKQLEMRREDVQMLEVSQSRSTRGKWLGLGLLAGIAVGAAIGASQEADCGPRPKEVSLVDFGAALCNDFRGMSTAAGVFVGALAGPLLFSSFSHGEKWQATPLEQVRLTAGRSRGGVGLSVTFSF